MYFLYSMIKHSLMEVSVLAERLQGLTLDLDPFLACQSFLVSPFFPACLLIISCQKNAKKMPPKKSNTHPSIHFFSLSRDQVVLQVGPANPTQDRPCLASYPGSFCQGETLPRVGPGITWTCKPLH